MAILIEMKDSSLDLPNVKVKVPNAKDYTKTKNINLPKIFRNFIDVDLKQYIIFRGHQT